ncbi:MAG: hypothetical protein R3F53_17640 [Gammaproteobacteria bacterium]
MIKSADAEQIDAFCEQAEKIGERGEWDTRINARRARRQEFRQAECQTFSEVGWWIVFRTLALENKRLYPITPQNR